MCLICPNIFIRWTVEADEAAAEAAAAEAAAANDNADKASSVAASVTSSVASALELRASKRRYMAVGIAGVYLVWAIFAWCVSSAAHRACALMLTWQCSLSSPRFIFTYAMLIYKLLGDSAQQEFVRSWGVS